MDETPELPLSAMWGPREKLAVSKQGNGLSLDAELASTLILDSSAPRKVRR